MHHENAESDKPMWIAYTLDVQPCIHINTYEIPRGRLIVN